MPSPQSTLGRWTNSWLNRFGLELKAHAAEVPATSVASAPAESIKVPALTQPGAPADAEEEEDAPGLDEGFAEYLAEAQRLEMDLNDYLEEKMGWGDCYHLIEPSTFPYLQPDSIVLELGPGSGRWSRHLAGKLTAGELHLVDNSPWKVSFLQDYFHAESHVHVYRNDGYSLGMFGDETVDLVCSYGTFIYFQLGQFYSYGKEFFRILRPGGHVVLDFIDLDTDSGWKWFLEHSGEDWAHCFTYCTADVVEDLFKHVGFEIAKSREYIEDFHFIVLRKPVYSEE